MTFAQNQLASRKGQTIWIVADEQTAGRGRLERKWTSPPGNLYMTVVMDAPAPLRDLAKVGYAAGMALHRAATDLRGSSEGLSLKWPNDLLFNGAKVSGLLMEAHEAGKSLSIGIGLNLVSYPQDTPYPATHLVDAERQLSPAEAFSALSHHVVEAIGEFDGGRNFAKIREAWLAVAAMRNEPATIRLPHQNLSGIVRGIDMDGRLILDQDGQRALIDAGDVFPLDINSIPAHQKPKN
jgi:BirA family transcriptional regulator, biotin operon repressor / biotin---[acetyl-CoA-carboxylase] ligase